MDQRKSILETVTPTDAVGRLAAKNRKSHAVYIVLAVLIFFGAVVLGAALFRTSSEGVRSGIVLPSVNK